MPKLTSDFKQAISSLSPAELKKIIFRFSRNNQAMYDTLSFEYVKDNTAIDLFEEAKEDIEFNFDDLSGRVIQKKLAKAIGNSVQSINEFKKITKDKKLEADLLVFLLKIVFDTYSKELGTCWSIFDSKVAVTTNRLYNLITKKLHQDFLLDYEEDINKFLNILKKECSHLNYVYKMPNTLEKFK
ncbi:MAG: hypothetical protein K8S23_10235 [Candidatus Cloacimonetes bacterium]|nr:hypothetical protein [Candidatus Cloacimonadota bacterium]